MPLHLSRDDGRLEIARAVESDPSATDPAGSSARSIKRFSATSSPAGPGLCLLVDRTAVSAPLLGGCQPADRSRSARRGSCSTSTSPTAVALPSKAWPRPITVEARQRARWSTPTAQRSPGSRSGRGEGRLELLAVAPSTLVLAEAGRQRDARAGPGRDRARRASLTGCTTAGAGRATRA